MLLSLEEIKRQDFGVAFIGVTSIPNFMKTQSVILELLYAYEQ
jgi:hypothetical protein